MNGLILKDILFIKNNFKSLLMFLIFVLFFSFMTKDFDYMAFIIPFFTFMIIINTFAYDEYNKCDTFILTLPFSRKQIVKSKYIFTVSSYIIASIICNLFMILVYSIQNQLNLDYIIGQSVGGILGISITAAILYPFIYKFGIQKARAYLFAVIIGISLISGSIIVVLKKVGLDINIILTNLNNLNIYIAILGIILTSLLVMYISYRVSVSIYSKKEF